MRARTHNRGSVKTLNEKLQEHHKFASTAVHRALAARAKYARGDGKVTPVVITVMTGGEETHWVVLEPSKRALPIDGPSRTLGSVNLRVFGYDPDGETDQPLVEVGDQ